VVTEPPEREEHERTVYASFDPAPTLSHLRGDSGAATTFDGSGPVAAIPLYDNIHVLAPVPPGLDRHALMAEAERMVAADRDTLDPFDLPERDRMYALAVHFVSNHVRRVKPGSAIRSGNRSFREGTIVISEKPFPRFPLRLVRLNWAIDRHGVFDVHDHRVLRNRLTRITIPPRRFIWAPGRGDTFDVAYLLANVCAILDIRLPEPVAATGDVALENSQVLGRSLIEDRRQAAADDGIAHLILPFATHLMPGEHQHVRYWPCRDVNEAVFSLLAAASSDLAIPDLKHRWRVKMAFSWISLLAVFLAIGGYQFAAYAGGFPGDPLLLRWTLGITVVLLAVSLYATHKYRQIDT
jgi:hypothetical protein